MNRLIGLKNIVRSHSSLSSVIKQDIQAQLNSNPVLRRIRKNKHNQPKDAQASYNALNTLALDLKSKTDIFNDTKLTYPDKSGVALQLQQYVEYAKALLNFYKTGIKNVWNNAKFVRELKKKYYVEQVGVKGIVMRRQFQNGHDLIERIAELKSLGSIERSVIGKSNSVLQMTRHEFQTVLRTERDYYKIPLFSIILLIFAECTPFICFLFPEITPSTCVLPNLTKKLHDKKNVELLNKFREGDALLKNGKISVKTYQNLPIDELRALVKIFRLKHRLVPVEVYPESILRQRLKFKLLEFQIDNEFLIDGIWSLERKELLRVCLDRGLIFGLAHTDDELRLRLIQHLANFDENLLNCNVYGLNYLENGEVINFTFRNFSALEAEEILSLVDQ